MQPKQQQQGEPLQQASSSALSLTVSYFSDYHDELEVEFKRSLPWFISSRERLFQHRKFAILHFLRLMLHQLETTHRDMVIANSRSVGELCLPHRRGMLIADTIKCPIWVDIGADHDPYVWALSQQGIRRAKRAFTMAVLMRQAIKMHRTIDVSPMSPPLFALPSPRPKDWEYRRLKTVERYASERQMAEHGMVIIRMDAPVPDSSPSPAIGTPTATKGSEMWFTAIPAPPPSGYSPENVDSRNRPISPSPSSSHLPSSSSNSQHRGQEDGSVHHHTIHDGNGNIYDADYDDYESDDEAPLFSDPKDLAELAHVMFDPAVEDEIAEMTDMRLEHIREAVWNHWEPYYQTQSAFYNRLIALVQTLTSANVNQTAAQRESNSKRSFKPWFRLFSGTANHTRDRDRKHEEDMISTERSRYLRKVPEH